MKIPTGHHAIYFYGTLKNSSIVDGYAVKGRLFDLGSFPGIILGGEKDIPGQVAIVSDSKLKSLDSYEGVPFLYTRERATARSIDEPKEAIDVWVYQWAGETSQYKEIDKW